jgi:hypothetical protein
MADDMQLSPSGGAAGYRATPAVLWAVLLVAAGAVLGLIGGAIWAAAAPRVVYQVATLNPPTAYAINPETSAFITADGIYTFIALGGGALLGLAGYLFGVRRYGPVPMVGVVLGSVAAAFVVKWAGPLLTGQNSFDNLLATSKTGALLRAPIALGAHGALAFWPVAAALVAGGLEMTGVRRARQTAGQTPGARGLMRRLSGFTGGGYRGQQTGSPGQPPGPARYDAPARGPGEPTEPTDPGTPPR